jgi:hypothetical protein
VEGVVELPLVVLGHLRHVDGAERQQVEQGRVAGTSVLVLAGQCGEPLAGGASVGGDLGEPALQGGTPFGVDVVVAGGFVGLQLFEQVGLGPAEYNRTTRVEASKTPAK